MKIFMVTPAPRGSRSGNRITALRWSLILRGLGHRVKLRESWSGEECDLLLALHATHSSASVEGFSKKCTSAPVILALTGTDIYQDGAVDPGVRKSIDLADRIVVLQPAAADELPEDARTKVRVIRQSVPRITPKSPPRDDIFEICCVGHLRSVKDPFLAASAVGGLPESSRVHVVHVGRAMDQEHRERAVAESRTNSRWMWLGELPRGEALDVMSRSRALLVTSLLEGGANVVSEAVAADVPVISTRIAGTIGLLGEEYGGYFEPGDAVGLGRLLEKAELEPGFLESLRESCREVFPLLSRDVEREAWRSLLLEVSGEQR